ncbi:MAG: HAMP domain-containing histidine kinase [Melioribacteraceae bacterium]|nr:HAMP domain-containing histidine kinase [Melioribacteraceae bacterium]
MEKDTYLSRIKEKQPLLTKSVKKNAALFTGILFVGYLIFNFFTVIQLNYYFTENIDSRIKHELEHIKLSVEFDSDTLNIIHPTEFNESDLSEITENPFFLQIYDTKGELLFGSKNLSLYQAIPISLIEFSDEFYFKDLNIKYESLRTGYTKIFDSENGLFVYIQLSAPKAKMLSVVEDIIFFNLYTLPLAFILFVVISIFFAKRLYNPINKIINLANEISATNLKERLTYEADKNDELGRLKTTLNDLFERLDYEINQISNFSDNASHQLMTPLTAISTELEYILKKDHDKNECLGALEVIQNQTEQMIHIVKTLLILAKDCVICRDEKKVFNLSSMINEEINNIYQDKNLIIECGEEIYIKGVADYFQMVLQNLIDNAIKYSDDNSSIKLITSLKDNYVKISVEDNGIGIADDEKIKVFEKFYRGTKIENSGIKGYGLGLSLVESIVTKLDGKIFIEDNKPTGTIFIIELPVVTLT